MIDFKEIAIYILGAFVTLATWIFRVKIKNLEDLQKDVEKHKKYVEDEFASIHQELALNAERDNNNYENIMSNLLRMQEAQEKLLGKMDEWQKNIENFYYLNPQLKKPDL